MFVSSFLRVNTFHISRVVPTCFRANLTRRQPLAPTIVEAINGFHPSLNSHTNSRSFSSRTGVLGSLSGGEQHSNTNPKNAVLVSSAAAAAAAALLNRNKDETSSCETSHIFPEEALTYDTYGGVTINMNELTKEGEEMDSESFVRSLEASLNLWKSEGKRGIWINIPTNCSNVVPLCAKLGFEFQHAKNGLLVMTQWLPEDSHSRLPHGPTHQVGIGAVILHPVTHKMLVVQEKTGPAAAKKLWKMPTGLTDPGEDIVEAAIREAKEETGLDVEFDRIICMRQAHGGIFNHSDMFFVCLLHLAPKYKEDLMKGIEVELIPQEEEIAEIKWMSTDEFASQEVWQGSPLYKELNNAMIRVANSVVREYEGNSDCSNAEDDKPCGLIAKNLATGWRPGSQTIYLSKL